MSVEPFLKLPVHEFLSTLPGTLVPLLFVQSFYWLLALRYDWLPLFSTRYEMALVMIIGSVIGGLFTHFISDS